MKYNVDDVIYLSNHLDKYPNFRIDIELLLRKKGLKKVLSKDDKSFNYKDKKVQESCQKYGNIAEMVVCSATSNDVRDKLRKVDYMYEYIINNINKLDSIKELLIKLKKLGFVDIIFDTYMKLTNETFSLYNDFVKNKSITYLDNIETLPSMDIDKITYISNKSDYRIELITSSSYGKTLALRGSIIYLTSLTFDKDKLPDSLEASIIYDKVVFLTRNNKKLVKKKTI